MVVAVAREGVAEHESPRALRIGRREERAHGAALGDPEQHRPLRSGGVHDGAHVVHPLLERRGAWIANGGAYAQWRRGRRGLALHLAPGGPNRLLLDITNEGEALEGAVVRVHLNAPVQHAEVVRTVLQQEAPAARFVPATATVDIALPSVRRRSTQTFAIDLTRLEEAS